MITDERYEALLLEAGFLYVINETGTGRCFIAAQTDFLPKLLALLEAELKTRPKGVDMEVAAFEYSKVGYTPSLSYSPDGVGREIGFHVEPLYRLVPPQGTAH